MNSKTKGDIAEANILARLVSLEKRVLIPWGDNCRYDLVIDEDDKFLRIQVKHAVYKSGCVIFNSCSTNIRTRASENYYGQADLFGVYCPSIEKCYLISVDEVGSTKVQLRVEPTKSNQQKRVRWAKDYEI